MDPLSKKVRRFTNVFGDTVKTILGYGAAEATTTVLVPNVLRQRVKATDPRGLISTFAFNTRGLRTARTSPDAGTLSAKHDKGGNVRFTQDANQAAAGTVTFTGYDFANRPLTSGLGTATFSSLDPDAAPGALETTNTNWLVVRQYDAKPDTLPFPWSRFKAQIKLVSVANVAGRLSAIGSKSNGAWQVTLFSYDADGNVSKQWTFTEANGGASVLANVSDTLTFVRDLRNVVTERHLRVGASTTYNQWYDFNTRGLLWKVSASTGASKPGTPDVTYTYRPSGVVQDRQFAGGPLVPFKYTIREQLASIGDPALTTYPFSGKYTYNANGTISEAEFYSSGSPATAKRYKYAFPTYDALNRLKSADFSSWSGTAWTSTLAHDLAGINYDADGNLTALQRYRETGTLIDNLTYTIPAGNNRLSSVADAAGVTAEIWDAEAGSFTYDANGNLLTAPAPYSITAATYDVRNLPLSLTSGGVTSTYRYDESGQRITKQVGAGNTEVYLREGSVTLGVFTVTGAGAVASSFFNLLAGDRVIGRQPSVGSATYYHTDLLGSTRSVVQAATVTESYDFEPWGLLMPGRTLGSVTKEGFTSKERDAESGMDYFGARYYLGALGRWSSVDPPAENAPEWSAFTYVTNDPIRRFDTNGLRPCCVIEIGPQLMVGIRRALAAEENQIRLDWLVGINNLLIGEGVAKVASGVLGIAGRSSTRAAEGETGVFSISNWESYPSGIPQPTGPFRVVGGAEYVEARAAANSANRALHRANPELTGLQIHEIQPVKFGGNPTDPANKIALPPEKHSEVSKWWSQLLQDIRR